MSAMPKEAAIDFFALFFLGRHHIPRNLKPWGDGWAVSAYDALSTFDFDGLTRLVFLAHDHAVRVEVTPCNPQMLRIAIWQRVRDGRISERHPTLDDAVSRWTGRPVAPVSP